MNGVAFILLSPKNAASKKRVKGTVWSNMAHTQLSQGMAKRQFGKLD